ncbi:MAG: acyl-CoA dehydrogenase family protein, partial [Chloroflexota bacterium]
MNAENSDYLEKLEKVITDVIAPSAMEVDEKGIFPRASIDALGQAGLLGLLSAKEVGGMGMTP